MRRSPKGKGIIIDSTYGGEGRQLDLIDVSNALGADDSPATEAQP